MKIFLIGNDKSALIDNSNTRDRLLQYSKITEKYSIVIPSDENKIIKYDNLSIYSFGGENKLFQIIKLFINSWKLLKKEKFDVISVQDQYYLALISYLLAKKFKIGLEIQIHGFEKYNGLRKIIANFVIPRANAIRVVSQRLEQELIDKFKINQEKITVVPIYSEVGTRDLGPGKTREKFIFLTIGRLVKVKNIKLQIKALKKITEKYKNIELQIVGSGPEKENLENLVKDLNLESYVKFFGYQKDLESFYKNADVFMLTSDYEGWGLVIIEAFQYKLPIIMTDVGCANEIVINNENAIIIPVNDLNLLEDAMIKIYENKDLREKFVKNSEFALSKLKTKQQTLDLYKESWEKAKIKIELLILTQKVDINDGVLGFFHRWVEEFSKNCEKLTIICLYKGKSNLPPNVKLLSLGKETGENKFKYIFRFYKYIFCERKNYDNVFVHMNPEYIFWAAIFWKLYNKKIYLWYVHKSKNIYLKVANIFVKNIFTSSKESCNIKSNKIVYIGHGIDSNLFKKINVNKDTNKFKILYVGRISPLKNIDILIESFAVLINELKVSNIYLSIIGDTVYESDKKYLENIKEKIVNYKLDNYVKFFGNFTIDKMSEVYNMHDLSVNLSPTGGMDKTVLESLICETPCVVFNRAFEKIFDNYADIFILDNLKAEDLAEKIYNIYKNPSVLDIRQLSDTIKKTYSLDILIKNILNKINTND
ncbi:MAG TPA: glycosyltransferase [bacterium]|nr:glycosyltransferase [bacterium]